MRIFTRLTILGTTALMSLALGSVLPAHAANGDFVQALNFSQGCGSGIGVGITYDGANLWYSCYASSPDLLRANPNTGAVTASYNIMTGLGAIAYDKTRNAIWAAAGGSNSSGKITLINLDAGMNVVSSAVAFSPGNDTGFLDDGIAFDAADDTLYFKPDNSLPIHHYTTAGVKLADRPGPANELADCGFNGVSGLALGGTLIYEGTNGCSRVYALDKVTNAQSFTFSTKVVGDPNFRDEGLTCDPNTFTALGKQVMWSMEAFEPRRAHAYEIPAGSCGFGGQPVDDTPPSCDLTAVIDGPPKQIQVTVQDSDGGLKSIVVTDATNASVAVPPFALGSKDPVVVTATKIDEAAPSVVGLMVTDVAGNVTLCDPALLSVGNVAGERHQKVTLAKGEGKVIIHNGKNGIRTFSIHVNGQTFRVNELKDGEVATLDITSALTSANNHATVSGSGPKGSEAAVVIST